MEPLEYITTHLKGRSDLVVQMLESGGTQWHIVYFYGAVNMDMLQMHVFRPLCEVPLESTGSQVQESLYRLHSFFTTPYQMTMNPDKAIQHLLLGEVILLSDYSRRIVMFPFSQAAKRPVDTAKNERNIRGPKEAFVEDLETNLSLIRQRIKSPLLKVESFTLGEHTQTGVLMLYMEGICESPLTDSIRQRLSNLKPQQVLGSSFIEECLDDHHYSPFPQMINTERPDVAVSSLLEGRVLILTEGTPNHVIAPVSFYSLMQSAEDYYQRPFFSTWIRWVRYLFYLVTLVLPSAYVAITTFHPEMIPMNLLITIASSRDIVPFPAVLEAFMMELTFEVLREAGQRIPSALGQTISIVGALVVGEAAVQAGIVSAPMVIIVALTGISSFIIPHFALSLAVRFLRFTLLFMASVFGLFGVLLGVILVYIHMLSLNPFGKPYLTPLIPLKPSLLGDVLARIPWPKVRPGNKT
ncbi:spore germination protein [Paenibacillus rigui]|uniref:Spore germination protein n=1 Tax=Paenibacillus rigui TaxID=554312 RepID=A0A229UQH4_9BACL|nr:spore germination protein [Paenibacillus rigui]OXM85139.1 spore germination protein [Paenibacillus rigui]